MILRIADGVFFGDFNELLLDRFLFAFRDEETGECGAGLPGVQEMVLKQRWIGLL